MIVTAAQVADLPYPATRPKRSCTMKIALVGVTGFVGSAILKEALDCGHEVAAIVRNPDKLTPHEASSEERRCLQRG
jgi:hypothetical protein